MPEGPAPGAGLMGVGMPYYTYIVLHDSLKNQEPPSKNSLTAVIHCDERVGTIQLRAWQEIHSSCTSCGSPQCTALLRKVEAFLPGELTGWTTLAALQNTLSAYTLPPATHERL